MFHLRIVRNLRTVLWLVLAALVPLSAFGLYWANKTGLPDEWRQALEQEISKHGAHVEIGSLTYIPLQGFVAQNVQIFAEEEHIHEISRLERVQIVLDNAQLAAGEFRLRKIELRNARLALPVDPKNPAGEALHFSGIYGTIFMTGERLIEAQEVKAEVGGIQVTLAARLLGKVHNRRKPDDDKNEGRRREMIAHILNELQHWNFDEAHPPRIHLDIDGDLSDRTTIKAEFTIEAPSVEKKQYTLVGFRAQGNVTSQLLTVRGFSAEDARGKLSGHADYKIIAKEGRFDLVSSVDIPRLIKSWLATPIHIDLISGGNQEIQAAGDFNLSDPENPVINLTGHALCDSMMFKGVSFDSVDTWFSWQDGNLFLKDLKLSRPDGDVEAKVMIENGIVRLSIHSTLPAPIYKPFFSGQPLEKIIADFTENEAASTEVWLEGSFNTQDRFSWAYNGKGIVKNMSYRGVPVKSADCSFTLTHSELDFQDGSVVFDYSDYPLRKAFGGPKSATAEIKRISYTGESRLVTVESVKGDIWVPPLVRFFAPKIADDLEKYRFHRPPAVSGSGVIDVTPQGRTNLKVQFSSNDDANYEFLGKDITLSQPEANVRIRGGKVNVSDLTAEVFGGKISGKFENSDKLLTGELSWSDLAMNDLSSTYGFNMKGGGDVTGRLEFSLPSGDISLMRGEGLIALGKAELFSIPILGPLSPVMARVLDNKQAGFQRAKSAFCTFNIRRGILRTRDFQTATNSVTITGDGAVDLTEKTVDFTVRLNARGFLGLLTLPLRPFYGLFQFRGNGPLNDPNWENVHFTSPPEAQNDRLLAPPPKARIVGE